VNTVIGQVDWEAATRRAEALECGHCGEHHFTLVAWLTEPLPRCPCARVHPDCVSRPCPGDGRLPSV